MLLVYTHQIAAQERAVATAKEKLEKMVQQLKEAGVYILD